jgi:hypothetical protein
MIKIVAIPKDSSKPWAVHRRYNEFLRLKDSMGAEGNRIDNVPFPPKRWFNSEEFDVRRKGLEVWLQKVVAHPDSGTVWASRLWDFLDPQINERRNRTKRLVAERAKERKEEELEDLQSDIAVENWFPEYRDKVLDGVRKVLVDSMVRAVEVCSAPGVFFNNSRMKIPLPKELDRGKIARFDADNYVREMNEAAAKSLLPAVDVFKTLIKGMNITNIGKIWKSKKSDACTRYFKETSFNDMKNMMLEVWPAENDFTKCRTGFVTQLNIQIVGSSIEGYNPQSYVAEMALKGLFFRMAVEEEKIRRDPVARTYLPDGLCL